MVFDNFTKQFRKQQKKNSNKNLQHPSPNYFFNKLNKVERTFLCQNCFYDKLN